LVEPIVKIRQRTALVFGELIEAVEALLEFSPFAGGKPIECALPLFRRHGLELLDGSTRATLGLAHGWSASSAGHGTAAALCQSVRLRRQSEGGEYENKTTTMHLGLRAGGH
jgi:hypothetical protein